LCTLFQWHNQDPVSAQEVARHARIVERQGNRNPFVDNPAWVNAIWGGLVANEGERPDDDDPLATLPPGSLCTAKKLICGGIDAIIYRPM
jgi:hypothetical protein